MTPAQLVKRIHQLDRELDGGRLDLADVADRRGRVIAELVGKVGAGEAARLLGISRAAVSSAARRGRRQQ